MSTPTLDPGNVVVGTANGVGILIAPVGTAAPSTSYEAFGAGWVTLGYLSEDGIELSKEVETEVLRAWQSKAPLRTIVTGKSISLDFTMIELTPVAMALYFGEETPAGTDDDFTLVVATDTPNPETALAIDVRDGDVVVRYLFGRSTLSASGSITLEQASAQGLPVTLDALDDDGVLATIIRGSATAPEGP